MKLVHRIAYYLGGFAIGIVILFFFLSGKRTSCDYGPNARVLKNISTKTLNITPETAQRLQQRSLDSTFIISALQSGNVDFSNSNTNKDSCNIYHITYSNELYNASFNAQNCNIKATISNLEIENLPSNN